MVGSNYRFVDGIINKFEEDGKDNKDKEGWWYDLWLEWL